MMRLVTRLVPAALAMMLVLPLHAQDAQDPRGLQMTRAQLEAALAEYEAAASSTGYSGSLRERARRDAELVRDRLERGDFQVGDRIVLYVRGEPTLTDTFTDHMRTELARYIRDPDITAESLIRVAILGAVGRPGFFVLPASMLLEDALMAAGGPGGDARLDRMRVLRGDETVWSGDELQEAMIEGRTLDQLNLRAGDRVDVPQRSEGSFFSRARNALFVITPVVALLIRLF